MKNKETHSRGEGKKIKHIYVSGAQLNTNILQIDGSKKMDSKGIAVEITPAGKNLLKPYNILL